MNYPKWSKHTAAISAQENECSSKGSFFKQVILISALTLTAFSTVPVHAESFPSRSLRFIVPFVPGSITDIAARYYAQKLTDLAGQPVVVENRPGANGVIGVNAVLNAPADGYTVLIGTTSTLATNVALYQSLPYDPLKDLSPISVMVSIPSIIVAPGDSPYKNLMQLVDAARVKPDTVNYSAGATSYQLMGELFKEKSGITGQAIPYKGAAAALNAVLGKEVDFTIVDVATALGSVKGKTLKGLAVASERRLPFLPEVPTATEAGLPDFIASTWVAAAVSAKTPTEERTRLEALISKIATDPETQSFFSERGAVMKPAGADNLRAFQVEEIALWKRIVKLAKIELL